MCSRCIDLVDKVLGTRAEWIELGAPPDRWWIDAWLLPDDCRFWMDACMACQVAGYTPPFRPKVYRTLKAPEFADSLCKVCLMSELCM